MIPLSKIEFETSDPQKDWGKIQWATAQDGSIFSLTGQSFASGILTEPTTTRDWIGNLDDDKMKFNLVDSSLSFFGTYVRILTAGRVIANENRIVVILKLGIIPSLSFEAVLFMSLAFIKGNGLDSDLKKFNCTNDFFGFVLFVSFSGNETS